MKLISSIIRVLRLKYINRDCHLYYNPLYKVNDFCPCESGIRIRKCHGVKKNIDRIELNKINKIIRKWNKKYEK